MNFKAWDNNEATYGLPYWLLLVLKVCGRLWVRTTSGSGPFGVPTPPGSFAGLRLATPRNEGGLFGGERT